jgi:hypothetical protein
MELHGALTRAVTAWASPDLERDMYQLWPMIEKVQITADLEADDTLVFRAEIFCASADAAGDIFVVVETAAEAAGGYLEGRHDFQLNGRADPAGDTVTAEYTLSGFEPKLRRALGG